MDINWMEWIDALWIPVFILLLHKNQRILAAGFVLCNMLMLRMIAELMDWIGYPSGFLDIWDLPALQRGFWIYGAGYFLYLVIALYSPKSEGPLFIAMSITLFFVISCVYALSLVL
jgi:hypothetical protein